jgi:phage terminase large subunit-like protein
MMDERGKRRKLFTHYQFVLGTANDQEGYVYPWQAEFHNAGLDNPERLLMAANRVGKTECAAAEIAIHMTGEYPPWWKGRRFNEGVQVWAGGETNETVRDVVQEKLLGPAGAIGTGWIPAELIAGKVKFRQAGVSEVVDQFHCKHISGDISTCTLKTYEQGVEKWRGKRLHICWLDEEPEPKIFVEAQTRVLDLKGLVIMTATPHKGRTDPIIHFLDNAGKNGIYVKNVTWDDAPHLDEKEKARLWESYPPHERETRARGLPMMGSGAVFPIDEQRLYCDAEDIKPWFARINGVDFGINHPAAGAFCAHDGTTDTFYVYDCYRAAGETPIYHAPAMGKHGTWIPNAWPADGLARDKGSGESLKNLYRRAGAYMLPEHSAYRDGRGTEVEPGLIEMYEYMRLGKFKVVRTLREWFEEMRNYHRDEDGKLVKEREDIISATRYAFVMRGKAARPSTLAVKPKTTVPMLGFRRK